MASHSSACFYYMYLCSLERFIICYFFNCFLSNIILKIMLFIFGSALVFLAAWAFSSCKGVGATLRCSAGASCCGALALRHVNFSSCGSWALEQRLSSCGPWATDVTIRSVLKRVHKLHPCKMGRVNQCCVCSDSSMDRLFPFLSSGLPMPDTTILK